MLTAPLIFVLGINVIGLVGVMVSGILAYTKNQKRPLNRIFFLTMVSVAVYVAEYIVTPLMPNESLAYGVGFFSLSIIFIPIFFSQLLFITAGVEKQYTWYIRLLWGIALVLIVLSLLFPSLFLAGVEPRLYFPWWLVPGPLFFLVSVFFLSAFLFPFLLCAQRRHQLPPTEKKRLEYFLLFLGISLPLNALNLLLTFGIPFGPFIASFWTLGMIPIAYGIINDRLLDIRVVFARAALYSSAIALLAAFLALLISLNTIIVNTYPWVQFWTVPIFTAAVAFIVGRLLWFKFLENDRVKYEFITVATHKLRTPLTQISWGVRMLLEQNPTSEVRTIAEHIQKSNNRLIELTNLLFETTEESTQSYAYQKESVDLVQVVTSARERLVAFIETKKLSIQTTLPHTLVVQGDTRRLASVVEVLLENAINYSPHGGVIELTLEQRGTTAYFSVRDQGIGVSPDEQSRIFTRFYRTDAAKRADTEGVGLGLAMAKNIITRHRGKIGMASPGEGKGSIFWFMVPR